MTTTTGPTLLTVVSTVATTLAHLSFAKYFWPIIAGIHFFFAGKGIS
jgi:hypothetical protein